MTDAFPGTGSQEQDQHGWSQEIPKYITFYKVRKFPENITYFLQSSEILRKKTHFFLQSQEIPKYKSFTDYGDS
jgi:hypothetical protein